MREILIYAAKFSRVTVQEEKTTSDRVALAHSIATHVLLVNVRNHAAYCQRRQSHHCVRHRSGVEAKREDLLVAADVGCVRMS